MRNATYARPKSARRPLTRRERELYRRCIVLMAGVIFFSFMAMWKAMSGDYYGGGNVNRYGPDRKPQYPYYDDQYDVMSDDDHLMAMRLKQNVVGTRPVYYRRKAARPNDSVTIIINENTSSELTTSNDLKRDSSANTTLTNWLTPSLSGGFHMNQHGQAAGGSTPTYSWNSSRAHKSDSSIDRSQVFSSTLTGKVLSVLPNGYLVIEARKRVGVNGEIQTLTLTGIVNPDHMDADSAVKAEYIMDVTVNYDGKGPMTRMNKRGWFSQFFDFVNPF